MSRLKFSTSEITITLALAAVFALRMLGLFMILPIFASSVANFMGVNNMLIGVAIGSYGLTQASLQIPLGLLSDYFGRKVIILLGLAVFVIGSVVAACSTSIYGIIIGRLLQGAGAIGSVLIVTMTDNVCQQLRTRAMALIGITIGAAFVLSMVVGPVLKQWLGLSAIFWLTALLGVFAIILVARIISEHDINLENRQLIFTDIKLHLVKLLVNKELLNLNLGVFSVHASLAALFLVLPNLIIKAGVVDSQLWKFYLVVLITATIISMFLIMQAEKNNSLTSLRWFASVLILLAEIFLLIMDNSIIYIIAGNLLIFFIGFNLLEANLPTWVAAYAEPKHKGMAMGLYSSFQFLGMFFGGTLGGWLNYQYGLIAVLAFCMLLILAWIVFCLFKVKVKYYGKRYQ